MGRAGNINVFWTEAVCVEVLIICGILAVIGYSLYRSGKRDGSREGYNVGLARGRRRRRSFPLHPPRDRLVAGGWSRLVTPEEQVGAPILLSIRNCPGHA